jgi:ArsR family transcriptional regulator
LSKAVKTRLDLVLNRRNGDEDAFARLAHRWDDLRYRYFGSQFHLEALSALLPAEWQVLDIGTGTGYLLPILARQFDQVTAVDPSAAMLELARRRVRQEGLGNVRFRYGRLESLPISTSSKDLALAVLVLHHSSLQEQALRELQRVLKKGGTLLIVDFYPHKMEKFQQEMGDSSQGIDPEALTELISEIGFEKVQTKQLHTPDPGSPGGPEKPAPDLFLIQATR